MKLKNIHLKDQWEKTSGQNKKKFLIFGGIFLFVALGYWIFNWRYVSTDDAYVNANVVQIAARITGQVSHIYVKNNQYVHRGQVLFALDLSPYLVALNKAEAQVAIDKANLQNAQLNFNRNMPLVKKKILTAQAGDETQAKLLANQATFNLAKANMEQAKLNVQYTQVKAPSSGWVTNMSLRIGDNVSADQAQFALVSNGEFWVDANYKETEMAKIRPGQAAHIRIDMYPHHSFPGVVESISKGTGNVFSLLPPQNATGNWVKVTQRIPVRIRILMADPKHPLRIGSSSKVTVDTHSFIPRKTS